jgi:hypothetical protein
MATLAELWDAPADVSPNRIPSDVQAKRDQGSVAILQAELKKAQAGLAKATDPQQKLRLESDIAGLTREISRAPASKGAPATAPAAQPQATPQGTSFADLWESTAPTTETEKTTTQATSEKTDQQPSTGELAERFFKGTEPGSVRNLVGKFLKGGLETRAAVPGFMASAADVVAGAPSAIAGLVGYGAGRVFGLSPEEATAASQKVAAPLAAPVGRATGLAETQAYKQALPTQVMEYIGKNINEGAQSISQKFGVPVQDVEAAINATLMATGAAAPKAIGLAKKTAAELQVVKPGQVGQPAQPGMVNMGAAAVPDAATIKQALSVATPELQKALANIPPEKVNIPTLQRHIEADTLPIPVRLTEGQATGDIVKLSNEQNRRGKDPSLAQRFNKQNGQLVENLGLIREKAAPDVYGTKTIENSQGIIDAYKSIDSAKTADISKAYKALEDANGGQFPVDGKALATNAEAMLGKKLKSEFLPPSIKSQLERFKSGERMTFEQFEAMRTNLAAEIRKAERSGDGNAAQASSIVRQALEDLPMQGSAAAALKPLADSARSLAKQRFDMLKKDPAYKAAVDDIVPADKYIDKFVINGVNKNINTMVQNLGKDSPAHQHMAAGTVNWLKDKAGIVDETGNFRQDSYNRALKKLEDVKNLQEIFNPEAASQLKTLGNVARYTQAQPRGAFVNNSNTLVGAMADKAAYAMEQGANIVGGGKMGIPIGSMIRSRVQQYKATKETEKALETGAGTKQTGQ